MGRGIHYFKDRNGKEHKVEEYGWDKETVTVCVDNYKIHDLKMYYRHEWTWDDHLGNTPCGYYAIVPIKYYKDGYHTERHRVYLDLAK